MLAVHFLPEQQQNKVRPRFLKIAQNPTQQALLFSKLLQPNILYIRSSCSCPNLHVQHRICQRASGGEVQVQHGGEEEVVTLKSFQMRTCAKELVQIKSRNQF